MSRFLAAALLLAACGERKKDAAPPPPTPPVALDAAPAAPPIDAPVAAATAPPRPEPCPVAHAATTGDCTGDGLSCVLLLSVAADCTYKVAKELPIPTDALGDDPSQGVLDLAWPRKDGPLYLVLPGDPWRWGKVDAPLAAPADALAKLTWKPEKIGEMEPEGFQYGLATDGKSTYLAGCARWSDCGPDAEECEEWECTKHLFVDAATGKKVARAPRHPFAQPFAPGKVTPTVTVAKRGKDGATCAAAGKEAVDLYEVPDAIVALSDTDWLAIRYQPGSRMHARWSASPTYMRGCDADDRNLHSDPQVGPSRLWAIYEDDGWALQHGAKAAPLSGPGGATHVGLGAPFAWSAD